MDDPLVLPRVPRPDPGTSAPRPVAEVVTAQRATEGAGFTIRRPFPGGFALATADPFLLLDHLGRAEILQAIEDNQSGRLGIIPADQQTPRRFA